jgi:hypothetical protein
MKEAQKWRLFLTILMHKYLTIMVKTLVSFFFSFSKVRRVDFVIKKK